MRFWDSSAVVALLLDEPASRSVRRLYRKDTPMLVWWAAEVECASAVSRAERGGELSADAATLALTKLDELVGGWMDVEPTMSIRRTARRVLRVHPLRAADALQLAAAIAASEGHPSSIEFLTLDQRLADAGRREGLVVPEIA